MEQKHSREINNNENLTKNKQPTERNKTKTNVEKEGTNEKET